MSTPAILYAAKSTEDVHGSLGTQLADCRTMAEREGWEVVAEFSDEGFSAYKGNRGPALSDARERAAEAAQTAGDAVLVVQHSDRLARGAGDAPGAAEHLAEIMFWAKRHRVQLRSVQDDQSLTNPLLAFVMGERNFEDSRRKSEAVKAGMARRAKRGKTNGGPRPYGYRWEGPKGERRLAVEGAEAVIVRRIFDEFVAGRSQKAMTRDLTNEGVSAQRGGAWHQGTVARILANPLYMGHVRLNGEVHEGQHEAIVSPDLWERARALREALARTPTKGRGRRPKGGHLFTNGHLRCGRCGGAMIPRTYEDHGRNPAYAVYACYTRVRLGPDACSQRPVKREQVDGALMDYFQRSVLDVEATQRGIEAAVKRHVAEVRELRQQAERDEQKARDSLARIKRDYMEGTLDAADWQEFRGEIEAEIKAVEAKLERLRAQEGEAAEDTRLDAEAETLRYLTDIRAAIIGTVRDAEGAEAVRAALFKLFDGFTLKLTGSDNRDVFYTSLMGIGDHGQYELVPHVREDAIAGYGPSGVTAKPRRIALGQAKNNDSNGLASAYLLAPIPLGDFAG